MISRTMQKTTAGFTLIELMITVVIVGILASVAYPSYMDSVKRTRREEGKRTLLEAAQMMENYYAMNVNYSGAVTGTTLTIFTANDNFDDYYGLTASAATSTFTLSAAPKDTQLGDACGTLTITQNGTTSAGTTGCW
jgi:type IV pilus assembly protein PilE